MHIEGYPTADRLVALETETGRAIEDYLLHQIDLTAAFDSAQLLGNLIKGNLPQFGPLNACLRRVSASIGHCPGGASEGFNVSPHMIANVAAIDEPIGESRAKGHQK